MGTVRVLPKCREGPPGKEWNCPCDIAYLLISILILFSIDNISLLG